MIPHCSSWLTFLGCDNVRVIPDAGDIEFVGADTIAKLSAQTSEGRPVAAWDQRIVIVRVLPEINLIGSPGLDRHNYSRLIRPFHIGQECYQGHNLHIACSKRTIRKHHTSALRSPPLRWRQHLIVPGWIWSAAYSHICGIPKLIDSAWVVLDIHWNSRGAHCNRENQNQILAPRASIDCSGSSTDKKSGRRYEVVQENAHLGCGLLSTAVIARGFRKGN